MAPKNPKFEIVTRQDGSAGHNVAVAETPTEILIKIDKTCKTVPSSKGNPILATSRGFVTIGDGLKLSLNLMAKKN